MKKVLLVVGMHRSGTSALAGALSILGVDFGEDLLPAKSGENERGFFELKEVHSFHERLLLSGGRTWDTPWKLPPTWLERFATPDAKAELIEILKRNFADSDLWSVKDPRLCQLLPLWREVLSDLGVEVGIVHIIRQPGAVARSLAKRNDFPNEKSGILWLDHNLTAEHDARGLQRAFVSYEHLLDRKMETLEEIGVQLGITWPRRGDQTEADIEEFLTRDLDHTGTSGPGGAPAFGRWSDLVTELNDLLRNLSGAAAFSEAPEDAFDLLRTRQEALEEELDPILLGHSIHLVLGSGGLRDLETALDSAGEEIEAAKAYARRVEEDLRKARDREGSSKDFIAALEKDLGAHREHAAEIGSYAGTLESGLQEKEELIRALEAEVRKQVGLIAGHEKVLQEATRYTRSLESELEKHQIHQKELTQYTQKLLSELEKHQNLQGHTEDPMQGREDQRESQRPIEPEEGPD